VLPQVLDRWTRDGDDGPAFLVRVEPQRYTLAPAYAAARDFLLDAGRREAEGRRAGRHGAASRHRPPRGGGPRK
jgi:hypothetical protein